MFFSSFESLITVVGLVLMVSAQGKDLIEGPAKAVGPGPDSKSCAFNSTFGPNIMVGIVRLPDNSTEINAWLYGYNWCSHSNFVSRSADICKETSAPTDAVELMRIPLTDKMGNIDWDCYANVDIRFHGCKNSSADRGGILRGVGGITARITAQDGSSSYEYQCIHDRECHSCVYNGQIKPASEVELTAFMSCGVMAGP
ncbi:hypothetical protein AC579_9365 [Pseudocercospora musae]|uniref:Secreted protein n=1 Tax=Pseudocercospora musae TaxID=113226 RepID=A0A139I5L2_9PEZI|nr:hypothetical protein AC579_9365 [Pseudocercospora musae]